MKKMLEISKCGRCNHFLPMLCVCSATKGATLAENEPPSWCPLPDAGWQPIETAPKDGIHILLYRPIIMFVGFYATGCDKFVAALPGLPVIDPHPTHWRPLPEPPSDR